jgi:hypothetical protein
MDDFLRHRNFLRIFPAGLHLDANHQRKIRLSDGGKSGLHDAFSAVSPFLRPLPHSLSHTGFHFRSRLFKNHDAHRKNHLRHNLSDNHKHAGSGLPIIKQLNLYFPALNTYNPPTAKPQRSEGWAITWLKATLLKLIYICRK